MGFLGGAMIFLGLCLNVWMASANAPERNPINRPRPEAWLITSAIGILMILGGIVMVVIDLRSP